MKVLIIFLFFTFVSKSVLADVKGVIGSKSRDQEINIYYHDDNHFRVDFVNSASKNIIYYFTKSAGKAYVVSIKNGTPMAINLSHQLRTKESVECTKMIILQRNNTQTVVGGIEGEVFSSIINKDPGNPPMILSKESLAQKITAGYFIALGTMSNDGRKKPNSFVDPLSLYTCIRDTGFPAVLSENPNTMLRSVAEIELPNDFYSLPNNAYIVPARVR